MESSPQPQDSYIEVEMLPNCSLFPAGHRVHGHVCHPSQVVEEIVRSLWSGEESAEVGSNYEFAYNLHPRGGGETPTTEGYSWKNVLASYVHLQFASNPDIVQSLITRCQDVDIASVAVLVEKAAASPIRGYSSFSSLGVSPGRPVSVDVSFRKGSLLRAGSTDHFPSMLNKRNGSAEIWSSASSFTSDASVKLKEGKEGIEHDFSCDPAKRSDSDLASNADHRMDLRRSMSFDDITIPAKKGNNKIVALSPTSTEILVALGLQDRIIALSNLCQYPEYIKDGKTLVAKTKFDATNLDTGRLEMKLKEYWCKGETAFELDKDYLRQEQPGLVLLDQYGDPNQKSLDQIFSTKQVSFGGLMPIQPTMILSHNIHRLSEIFDYMLKVAHAADTGPESEVTIDKLRSRIAAIGSIISKAPSRERVVVLTGLNPLIVGGFWIPDMVAMAGGEPCGSEAGKRHQRITWEQLQELAPDVLILAASTWEETKQELPQLASLPGWWSLPAMKSGQLYACEQVLFTIPGPRSVDGTELLARILHPNLAGNYGKKNMAWSCILRNGRRCRPSSLSRHFCALL